VRLAIADPPYLGRAERHYGIGAGQGWWNSPTAGKRPKKGVPKQRLTTEHPDAVLWDDPDTHQQLVQRLHAEYDGWAVAMWPTSLPTYLAVAPADARVCVWHKPNTIPGGGRVLTRWEPVLVYVPPTRRHRDTGPRVPDVFTRGLAKTSHTGTKPAAWTRWILDLLGYDPESDTVDDLFTGSGAVAREIAQQVWL